MNSLVLGYRRFKRNVKDFAGYVQLDRRANEVVRRTDFTRCPKPVLLLYGFFSTRRVFEILELRLRRDGYCVWSINLGGAFDRFNTRGIDESAQKVHAKVEKLYARYDLGPLTIIGHSKGGLIGSYYVKRLGGERRVKNLVTLGSPFQGTPVAYLGCATLGWFAPSMWQMTPRSPFLRALREAPYPESVRVTSIYSRGDGVATYPTAVLDARGAPNVFNVEVPPVTHQELLCRHAVYESLRRELALGYGEPAPPARLRSLSFAPSAAASFAHP